VGFPSCPAHPCQCDRFPTVVFLVIYAILFLLMLWSYAKVGVDAMPAARCSLLLVGGVHIPGYCSQGTFCIQVV